MSKRNPETKIEREHEYPIANYHVLTVSAFHLIRSL